MCLCILILQKNNFFSACVVLWGTYQMFQHLQDVLVCYKKRQPGDYQEFVCHLKEMVFYKAATFEHKLLKIALLNQ